MGLQHILIAALLCLTSCRVGDTDQAGETTSEPPSLPAEKASKQREILAIRLTRSPCFGSCPIYEVELLANGQVNFVGEGFVEQKGAHTSMIAPENFAKLAAQVKAIGFFSMREQYFNTQDGCITTVTDHPSATVVVASSTGDKQVLYYYGCRGLALGPQLKELADLIDQVAGTKQWVGDRARAP